MTDRDTLDPTLALSLVVPVFNEAEAVGLFIDEVTEVFKNQTSIHLEIVFVDDGSTDGTWALIESLVAQSSMFVGVKLSRNHCHQHALLAGLSSADGDAVISLDADLQDDFGVIERMVDAYAEG